MPIPRLAEHILRRRREQYPVIALTGPRQSGKTTLCRMACGDLPMASLEQPDVRSLAREDPPRVRGELCPG